MARQRSAFPRVAPAPASGVRSAASGPAGAYAGDAGRTPSADARTRILDAATALLAEHGLRSLTQPRVCKKSGLRQSHLTYYFPTRRDLMIGVAQRSLDALSQPLLAQARSGRLTPAALARTLGAELADRGRVRVIIGLVTAAEDDPLIAAALQDLIGRVRGKLAALFKLLGYPDDADSVALAHMMLVGAAVLNHAHGSAGAEPDAGVSAEASREARLASQFIARQFPALRQRKRAIKPGVRTGGRTGTQSGKART